MHLWEQYLKSIADTSVTEWDEIIIEIVMNFASTKKTHTIKKKRQVLQLEMLQVLVQKIVLVKK